MATVKVTVGTRTALTASTLPTLANAAYATSAVKDNTTNRPSDLMVELNVTPGTVAGNKQAILFAQASLDNTNFQTGATAADEADLTYIGTLALATNATAQRGIFPVAVAYGGVLPTYVRFVVKNDSGVAFTAGTLFVSEVVVTVA
jgi:hypothetical protein